MLSGGAGATTTADNAGNYTFTGVSNGTYTVVPSHAGYTFTPNSQSVAVNGANVTGVNFTDVAQTFGISGMISPAAGGSGATVTLSGTANGTTTANASGAYTFTGLVGGSYTITPSNTGYTFSPASQSVSVSTSNVTGVNFADTSTVVAPTITTQPASQSVTAGQTATFGVVTAGSAPLSYQWQKNGGNISGATSSSYTIPATATSDSGSTFDVVVSNSVGSVTSAVATLTVSAAPVAPTITVQPSSQTVTAGQTAIFTVIATGTAPLSYQWKKNGASISGATGSSYRTPATTTNDSGSTFSVVVSNSAGTVTSSVATLTVNAAPVAPTITTQPMNQTVTAGQTATFTVTVTGTAPLSYQWYRNGAAVAGATSASYTTGPTTSSDNGAQFTVMVANTAGTATSSPATLTINAAPVAPAITTQPTSQTVTAGQTATFSVAATGTAPLRYQWYRNGVAISGALSPSYTTGTATSSDNGAQFTVVVSNTAGTATSSAAILTINLPPAQITATPSSASFGNVVVGTSNSQTITLANSGGTSATISQAIVAGTGFSTTLAVPVTIAAGGNTTSNAVFAPTVAGAVTGSVSLVSNAPGSPLVIPLSGTGVAATFLLGTNPTSLSFGNVQVGISSALSTTLTNKGNSNVTISSVTVAGTGFSVSGVAAGTVLTPNQSVTLSVAFAPTLAGAATGSVTVLSSATNSPAVIALSGTSVQHYVTLNWTAGASVVAGYYIYRGTQTSGPYTKLNSTPGAALTYNDSTVQSGLPYFYVVTAVDSNGVESLYSNEVSATIP